jgi:hypothetical protein
VGRKKLEAKDEIGYYRNNKELQAYANDIIDKDTNHNRGHKITQNNSYIGVRGLYNVSKDYKKIILLFDTRSSSRGITIYFPQEDIHSLYIKKGTYNNPITYFFKKNKYFHNNLDERTNNKFIYEMLKIFQQNINNNDIITRQTSIKVIIFKLLENLEVIALQIAPPFTIISLLFLKNESAGYINPAITVRLNNSINVLPSSLSSSSSSTSSSTPSIFSTWNTIIPSDYFKKKKKVEPKVKLITNEEERKKEEENINNMKMVNKERKKQINELEIAFSNKEPKFKPLPKEKKSKRNRTRRCASFKTI